VPNAHTAIANFYTGYSPSLPHLLHARHDALAQTRVLSVDLTEGGLHIVSTKLISTHVQPQPLGISSPNTKYVNANAFTAV
jgi:hypothetical protein